MAIQTKSINQSIIAGDTISIVVPVKDENAADVDVSSGFTAIWVVETTDGATTVVDTSADTPSGVAAPTMGNGSVTLALTSAQSATLAAGRYDYEVEVTETAPGTVTTLVKGAFTVRPSIAGAGAA